MKYVFYTKTSQHLIIVLTCEYWIKVYVIDFLYYYQRICTFQMACRLINDINSTPQ